MDNYGTPFLAIYKYVQHGAIHAQLQYLVKEGVISYEIFMA